MAKRFLKTDDYGATENRVVEDIAQLGQFFQEGLQAKLPNTKITVAENLKQARAALKAGTYDAIITDCGFPRRKRGKITR